MNEFDLLVIGAGPGGLWACIYAALNKFKVCLIESSEILGGQPISLYPDKEVEDIPGYSVVKAGVYAKTLIEQFHYHEEHFTVFLKTELLDYKKEAQDELFTCKLSNNQNIKTRFILFATGLGEFTPILLKPDLPKHLHEKVHYRIQNVETFRNKKVLIFGGGDSAVDWANYLTETKTAKKVCLIHRTKDFRALQKNIDTLHAQKIPLYLNYTLENLDANLVTIKNKESNELVQLDYDELICMYGAIAKPTSKTFLVNFELKANKFLTNRNQQTNIQNVYAIGQACIYDNRPNLIVVAQSEASVAVLSMVNELKNIKKQKMLSNSLK